ncbi:MAG: DUF3293 domain-containing protein [Betaproteobacteria bacterium]
MISPTLIVEYRDADYVVLAQPELVLRVGEPSERLDALLEEHGAASAAFVTAANPRSEQKSAAANAEAMGALEGMLEAAGYPRYPGEGRDAERTWREPSVLVVGIYRDNAISLGRLFGQNAIVFVEKGQAPELVLLEIGV